MSNRNKKLIMIFGFIAVILFLFLTMKKNPAIVKAVENALAPIAGAFSMPEIAGAYTPHDFPLPALDNSGFFVNFGCSFCSKTSVKIIPPTMAINSPAPQTSIPMTPAILPFGGSGASFYNGPIYGVSAVGG